MATLPVPAQYPMGWYCLAFASELAPGRTLTRRLAGRDVVLFRGKSGAASAVEAHCPHLGAHLGISGSVAGDELKCHFHGFCFDASGACTKTGYGTKPPPKAKLGTYALREVDGLLLVWLSPSNAAPAWEPEPTGLDGFSPLLSTMLALRGHPQETSENSVDLGHLVHTHGYVEVQQRAFEMNGPLLRVQVGFARPIGLLSRGDRLQHIEIDIRVHGLGLSTVDTHIAEAGFHSREWVLSTPVEPDRIELRLGVRLKPVTRPSKLHPALSLMPRALATRLVHRMAFRGFIQDVLQDKPIWEHKVHVFPPALAEGDGPIGSYRQWVKQFYEPPAGAVALRPPG